MRVKLTCHALIWLNAYMRSDNVRNTTWETFKILFRKQFYPFGLDKRWIKWHISDKLEITVQEYTTEFIKRTLVLGIPFDTDIFRNLSGLQDYIREQLKMFNVLDINDAY